MSQQERYDQQRRQAYHQSNLSGQGQQPGEAAQILHTLSEIDDLPLNAEDDPVMGRARNVNESVVTEPEQGSSGGGIMGKLGL